MPCRSKRLKDTPASPIQPTPAKKRRISSSSKPSVVIDHAAFPHIVESIILHSSPDVQSALRLTCRTLQRCVDTLFPRWITFGAPGGALPLKRQGTSYEFVCLLDNRLWQSVDWDDEGINATVHEDDVCVGCEREERCHLQADFPHMLADLGQVKMVRQAYTSCHSSLVNAQTCVTFFDFTSMELNQSIRWRDPNNHKCVFHFVWCPSLPLDDRWLDLTEDGSLTQNADEIVVVLSTLPPATDDPPSTSLIFSLVYEVAGAVFPMVEPMFFPAQPQLTSLTFVEVESWDYHWFPEDCRRPDCRRSETIKDLIVDIFEAFYYYGCPEGTREWLDDGAPLFFPTLDEYRDQVGDEQFALEMGKGWRSES